MYLAAIIICKVSRKTDFLYCLIKAIPNETLPLGIHVMVLVALRIFNEIWLKRLTLLIYFYSLLCYEQDQNVWQSLDFTYFDIFISIFKRFVNFLKAKLLIQGKRFYPNVRIILSDYRSPKIQFLLCTVKSQYHIVPCSANPFYVFWSRQTN